MCHAAERQSVRRRSGTIPIHLVARGFRLGTAAAGLFSAHSLYSIGSETARAGDAGWLSSFLIAGACAQTVASVGVAISDRLSVALALVLISLPFGALEVATLEFAHVASDVAAMVAATLGIATALLITADKRTRRSLGESAA